MKPVRPIWWAADHNQSCDHGFIPWDLFYRDWKSSESVIATSVVNKVNGEMRLQQQVVGRTRRAIDGGLKDATDS